MPSYRGKFKPKNPKKYDGNPSNIWYRSLLELRFMKYLDKSSNIVQWSSEEIAIPYKSPIDGKMHRYFPDFLVHIKQNDGSVKVMMVEIKPDIQTRAPKPLTEEKAHQLKYKRRYNKAARTFAVNKAKWNAAIVVCEHKGWEFKIMTEKTLGVKYGKS